MISYANILPDKKLQQQHTHTLQIMRLKKNAFYLPINNKNISFPGSIMMTSILLNDLFQMCI